MDTLIYFAIWAAIIFLMMRFGCGAHVMGHGHGEHDREEATSKPETAEVRWIPPKTDIDPVCGKTVHPTDAKSSVHDGYVYYFCSRECRERFETAPATYIGQPQEAGGAKKENADA